MGPGWDPIRICADRLAQWADTNTGMTALHQAGKNKEGDSGKDLWPPPEENAPPPPEEKNPLLNSSQMLFSMMEVWSMTGIIPVTCISILQI